MFKSYLKTKLEEMKLEISIFLVFLVVYTVFIIGNPRVFTSFDIYYSFMSTIPFTGILALAMTFVVILGEIDLSFPSVLAFCGWTFGTIFVATNNVWFAALCCFAVGIIAGLLNSLLIVKIGIPSIVATIGTQFFFRGLVNVCAQGNGIALVDTKSTIFYQICVGRIAGLIPAQAIWFLVLGITFWLILKRHKFGWHVLFVGDNKDSARMMGININFVKTLVFVQMGIITALVSILSNLEVTYFYPNQGSGYLLTTLAAVFIGGTSVFGGMGTIFGTFIGALIIGSLEAGIIALGMSGFWIQLFYGAIIMISVSIYAIMQRKSD